MMQRAANQPMRSQFTPQGRKFAAPPILQKRLPNAERSSKTGNDPTDGRYFHLRCRVTPQINFAVPDLPPHRHPPAIHRNARALPFEWLHVLFFEEAFKAALRVAPVLANNAQRSAFRRFGD